MVLTHGNFLYNHQLEQPVKPTFAHMLQLCLSDLLEDRIYIFFFILIKCQYFLTLKKYLMQEEYYKT